MKPAFLLLAALLLPTSPAMAANWHTLQSTPQMLLEADEPEPEASADNSRDKARKIDKKLKVWGKSTYSRPEQARAGDFFYSSAKSLLAINCTKRTHQLLQKIYYAADGQEIKFVRHGDDEKIEPIVPDSAEERIFNFACAYQAAKTVSKTPKRAQPKSVVPVEKPVKADKAAAPEKKPQKPEDKAPSKGKTPAPAKSTTTKSKDSAAAKPKP